ncbi:hypothetical protein [uncultured Kiloniella sp.]|uniref:hypothetical protein n=1 Tax=uncultured Kiloniella sp. TaxID=1133091 RepID=UPI00261FF36F|nr:hypothetical protein [uncultured Kiloniella sp.]
MVAYDTTELEKFIHSEYETQRHSLGWGLLYTPRSTLATARTVFMGLNPGGSTYIKPQFSSELGSSYTEETWGSYIKGGAPLQLQVRKLFEILDENPANVLSGNLVPFRSRNWASLENKEASLKTAEKVWRPILQSRSFRIVTMGKVAESSLVSMLAAEPTHVVETGWGNVKARFYKYDTGSLCCLPHLSRYKIFNRGKSNNLEAALREM